MFKSQKQTSQIPEVNLVPMMDVIMTILTFFIIVSMTLTNFQGVNVPLPRSQAGASKEVPPEPLVVGLDQQGQMIYNNQPMTQEELNQQLISYLQKNPQGVVVLKADRKLTYEQVVQVLGKMRDAGGDRVSLAIE